MSRAGRSRKCRSCTWAVSERISKASDARSARRRVRSSSMSARKASRRRISAWVFPSAIAVAERGASSRSASAPKKSPGPSVARIAGSASSADGSTILTAPSATT